MIPRGLLTYSLETRDYSDGEENANGYLGCTSGVPMHQHRDGWVAEKCKQFIQSGIDASRPLFLYLSFLKPHAGFNVPKEFEDWYRLEDIPDIDQPPWEREEGTHLASGGERDGRSDAGYWERRKVWEGLARRKEGGRQRGTGPTAHGWIIISVKFWTGHGKRGCWTTLSSSSYPITAKCWGKEDIASVSTACMTAA